MKRKLALLLLVAIFPFASLMGDGTQPAVFSVRSRAHAADPIPTVTFGVISDTHVAPSKASEKRRLATALKFFSSPRFHASAVAITGDLTDGGSQGEYLTFKSILDENKAGSVKLIASMGNHEGDSADRFIKATGDAPNASYVINGYHFITLSPGSGVLDPATGKGTSQGGSDYAYAAAWLKAQLDAAIAEDPKKPTFVFFHHPLRHTFYVSDEWYGTGLASDSGSSFHSIFTGYPQVVAFSGHIHSPNNHPESIWQDGGFTAVNTATTSYFEMESGMVCGRVPPDGHKAAQGLLVQAEGSKVTIRNIDFLADRFIPQIWVFDVSKPGEFPYTKAREIAAKAPAFPANAAIRVSKIGNSCVTVHFDQAVVEPNHIGDIVHSYRYDFLNKGTSNVDVSFKTWSEYYRLPVSPTLIQKAVGLMPGTDYELRIYAIDAYRKVSRDFLCVTFRTNAAK